jgi:hypothetical protein
MTIYRIQGYSMQLWKQIDTTPIPLAAGRIWVRENTGDYASGWSWTWPILRYWNLGRCQQWMPREQGAERPPSNHHKDEGSFWQLKSLQAETGKEK